MKTREGIELTEEEIKVVNSLKRLAKKWGKVTDRLWLFSEKGTLNVMMLGDIPTNKESTLTLLGRINPTNKVTTIDIPNNGGD